jgi:hypothetical protein
MTDDVLVVEVGCIQSHNFLLDGPEKRFLPLFAEQRECIDFTFVALSTGSDTLPTIKISEHGSPMPQDAQQTIEHRIMVAYA